MLTLVCTRINLINKRGSHICAERGRQTGKKKTKKKCNEQRGCRKVHLVSYPSSSFALGAGRCPTITLFSSLHPARYRSLWIPLRALSARILSLIWTRTPFVAQSVVSAPASSVSLLCFYFPTRYALPLLQVSIHVSGVRSTCCRTRDTIQRVSERRKHGEDKPPSLVLIRLVLSRIQCFFSRSHFFSPVIFKVRQAKGAKAGIRKDMKAYPASPGWKKKKTERKPQTGRITTEKSV